MKPRLILHIGFSKCGSTALQRFLLATQPILRRDGIVVVDGTLSHPGQAPAKSVAQVALGPALRQPGIAQRLAEALTALHAEMARHGDTTAILSSESLSDSPDYPALFGAAGDLFDLSLIAYVRPQEDLLPSSWKQSGLRHGHSLDDFLAVQTRRYAPNFLNRLAAWEEVIGRDAMQVGSLKKSALRDGDLFRDFCARLGWEFEPLRDARPTGRDNPSFDFHILRVLEQAHEIFGDADIGQIYNFLEEELPAHVLDNGKNPLSQEQREEIHAHYAKPNQKLVERFMAPLSYDEAFGESPSEKKKDVFGGMTLSLSRTLGYMLVLMVQQNQKNRELRNRIAKLENALNESGS